MSNAESSAWRPYAISGFGCLLGLVLVAEGVWYLFAPGPRYSAFVLGAMTSVPGMVGLIYAGYWLSESELPAAKYARVFRWTIGGAVVTTVLITIVNAQVQPMSVPLLIGTVRWSTAIGGVVGVTIGVIRTQSVIRRNEAERARRRKKQVKRERDQLDEFASIISHDLQNQLHAAQGNLELLSEECDSPYIDNIAATHGRMSTTIQDSLKLARAGQEVGDTERVETSVVIADAWTVVDATAATLCVDDTQPLYGDETWLQTLFENLFQNAIKHGGDDVEIHVGVGDNGFYVADNGPGIPESDRDLVFEPGYSTAEDGTGFGLRIVEKIVESHGWQVAVTESDHGGARFEITGVEFV